MVWVLISVLCLLGCRFCLSACLIGLGVLWGLVWVVGCGLGGLACLGSFNSLFNFLLVSLLFVLLLVWQ